MNTKQRSTLLLFTGGHHNGALAVIDWLRSDKFKAKNNSYSIKFVWVGRKTVDNHLTGEYLEVTKRNIKFYDLVAGKLGRIRSVRYLWYFIKNLLLIPIGFFKVFILLIKIKPDFIVSFGGFLSVPVVICGKILNIKSITHEQTTTIGLATKINSLFCEKVLTAWPLKYYDVPGNLSSKLIYTGMPIRTEIVITNKSLIESMKLNSKLKTIYITGGKEGATFFNNFVEENLEYLLKTFNIILQSGSKNFNVEKIADIIKNSKDGVFIHKNYILDHEIGSYFAVSNFVIARGGAHTCFDLMFLKKHAILVPLTVTSNNEQFKNAKVLEKMGLAKVLNEDSLNFDGFKKEILKFSNSYSKMKINITDFETKGQEKITDEILQILGDNS